MSADEPVVTIQFKDGSEHQIPVSRFKRVSIPLSHGQELVVEQPRPLWYWNNDLACEVSVTGGALGRGVFAPSLSNVIEVVAIPSTYAKPL